MILGLDISSSKIGIAITDENKDIIHLNLIKYKKAPLEDKAVLFSHELSVLKREYAIEHIFIEEPVSIYAAGRTTAHVISTLQRFNGMCSLVCRNVFGQNATLIGSRQARKLADITVPGRTKSKEVKKIIIEEMSKRYQEAFPLEYTRHGNYKPGTDDKADALVISLAGHKIISLDKVQKKMYI
jgi:RNase H-fold protein (predicted Holliday junction resolvase)